MDQNAQQPQPQIPSQPEFVTPSQQSSSKWKIVLIGFGIIILLAVGSVGGFWYARKSTSVNTASQQPTQNSPTTQTTTSSEVQMADWPVYTNTKFGYTIKYPVGWVVEAINEDSTVYFRKEQLENREVTTKDFEKIGYDISVSVYETSESLEQSIIHTKDVAAARPKSSVTKTTFKGYPAYRVVDTRMDFPGTQILFMKDGKEYDIGNAIYSDTRAEANETLDAMLATFAFTSTATAPTKQTANTVVENGAALKDVKVYVANRMEG